MDKRLKLFWKVVFVIGSGFVVQQMLKRSQARHKVDISPKMPFDTVKVMSNIVLPPEAFVDEEESLSYSNGAHLHHDDLTEISGLDDEAVRALNAMGITRFVDLARANAMEIYQELADLPASLEKIESWIHAARERVTSQ
ncbi:MAG: hypothetical protein CUN55_06485 [Phototrophicales bacterium]|nr:MAG: hypothetical protein CUN55_06485 [Phototrophicales bacterium]